MDPLVVETIVSWLICAALWHGAPQIQRPWVRPASVLVGVIAVDLTQHVVDRYAGTLALLTLVWLVVQGWGDGGSPA